jgi:hypothetical protein
MLPKTEWTWLVKYYQMAQEDPKGLISFPDGYEVSDTEAEARKRLSARGFLGTKRDGYVNPSLRDMFNIPYLGLTIAGEDEARRYYSCWRRTGLWYRDYVSHHWIVPVVTFIAGILGTLFVEWVVRKWF